MRTSFASESMPLAALMLIALPCAIVSLLLFLRYTGLSRTSALVAWTVTLILPALFVLRRGGSSAPVSVLASIVFILTVVPFALRLYSKWRNGRLTEAEQAPGSAGFRAWFSPANLIMAGVVSVSGSMGFGMSFPLLLLLTCGALALWPALNPAMTASQPEAPAENLSAEREKVLSLLEAGKISAEESAELLNALGASARPNSTYGAAPSSGAKLTLIGAGVVFLGFLFPWFEIEPLAEVSRLMSSVTPRHFGQQMQGMMPNMSAGPTFQITGGNIPNGLGWVVLVCAAAAALLPHLAHAMHRATLRTMRLVALGISSAIMLYLATQSLRHVAFGLVITFAGLFLEWTGLLREDGTRVATPFAAGTGMPTR
jgi:hypothetical protein